MMSFLNTLHRALDVFFKPFERFDPFWGMLVVSAVTGVLMLIVYKYTSNQAAIVRVKDKIKAHLLEAWIYREDVPLMLKAQGAVLLANLKYMALNLQPLVVMLIPVLILLVHLNFRYGMRPLKPGEETIVRTLRKTAVAATEMDESIRFSQGGVIETHGVRIEERGEVDWRIKAPQTGDSLTITAGGREYSKKLQVGDFGQWVTPRSSVGGLSDAFFYPGDAPLPSDGVLERIEVTYPTQSPAIPCTNWRPHWLIQYFVLSLIFGFALKGPFKVEI